MLSFFNRSAPIWGLPIYWVVAQFNPITAAALLNVYLVIVLIVVCGQIVKINSRNKPKENKINTPAWVGSVVAGLITVWGAVAFSNIYIVAAGLIVVMMIEYVRKHKLDKEL